MVNRGEATTLHLLPLLPPLGEESARFPSPGTGRGARGEGENSPSSPALLPPWEEGSMRFPSPGTGRGARGEGQDLERGQG